MAKKNTNGAAPAPATKRAAKPAAKAKTVTAKAKRPAAKQPAKPAAPKKSKYTSEDVALRAYFISEKRHAHGLPGNEHQDWLEAERQLAAESKRPAKAKA